VGYFGTHDLEYDVSILGHGPDMVHVHPHNSTRQDFLSIVCLSVYPVCMSVTFVHCGQTVGRIKIGETDRQTNNGLIAQGDPFYKRSPQKPQKYTINLG